VNKPLGPYSPFVRAGDFIIVSGQGGMRDGVVVEGGVAAQTAETMRNISARLADAGAELTDVVKTLCFLTDMGTFAEFNEAYATAFGDHRPARSTVEVSALPGGMNVEVEAWAFKPV
jgi:2-iminobutanoate/2-iminopropanoate deaminase